MGAFPTGTDLKTYLASTGIVDVPPTSPTDLIEYDAKMLAVKKRFEDWTGFHPFEASTTPTTRYFNPTDIRDGTLDLKGGLVATPTLTINGTVQVLNTDFWMEPENADQLGKPWTRISLNAGGGWSGSYAYTGTRRSIAVTGLWGHCANGELPEDVRDGCLAFGSVLCVPQLALNISGGRVALAADDIRLQFVHSTGATSSSGGPLSGEEMMWRLLFKELCPYRRFIF